MEFKNPIFTIGHSTHTTREFIQMLKSYDIEILVDIRHFPGSWHNPQFRKANLKRNVERHGIEYIHLLDLGGRRKVNKNSERNAGWRSPQFRGYADFMETDLFYQGMAKLIFLAEGAIVAIMCAEAVPWRCHRSMVTDVLLVYGYPVFDIFSLNNARPSRLTPFAKVDGDQISYPKPDESPEKRQ